MPESPRHVVRRGYDAAAREYLAARPVDGLDMALLHEIGAGLAPGDLVLDAGAGAGIPVTARLAEGDGQVVALDLSWAQVARGALIVPRASFVQGDLAHLPVASGRLAAVVSYYAIIHVPRAEHAAVFSEFYRVLRPGGLVLLCLGAVDLPEDHDPDSWLGVPMYWSHFDRRTNLTLLAGAGFDVVWNCTIEDPMGHSEHVFVLGRRP
ncbi:MAG TPA: class I SAM-dependent methyltransferase [Acidimicrobiales bacterium]